MTKYYINVWWRDGLWRWEILKHPGATTVEARGKSSWRWLAKRRALSTLRGIKAAKDEEERNKDRALSYEVEL